MTITITAPTIRITPITTMITTTLSTTAMTTMVIPTMSMLTWCKKQCL